MEKNAISPRKHTKAHEEQKTTAKAIDMKANIEYRTRNYESRSSENQRTALRFPFSILKSLFIIRYSAFLRKINQTNIFLRESSCDFVDKIPELLCENPDQTTQITGIRRAPKDNFHWEKLSA
jgi:hypothetical protein